MLCSFCELEFVLKTMPQECKEIFNGLKVEFNFENELRISYLHIIYQIDFLCISEPDLMLVNSYTFQ